MLTPTTPASASTTIAIVFGVFLVFALYEDYKQNPSDFKERFKHLVSKGSSMSPREQIAEMGYDITRPDFWKLGIKRTDHFLEVLQKLL
jgi:oligoendopeptidase F